MKNVKFKKVTMENFCCYKEKTDFIFQDNKVVLITGPNGVGKSSIFNAIPYCLYGSTPSGSKGDDVVNNEAGKNCFISVEFSIDSDDYICSRYVKNSKLGDTVILSKNSVDIKKGAREVVAEIERILVPQKLFMNTLLFGQKVKTFFTDLTDSEQKDIFRKVLQLDDFVLYYDETSKKLKESVENQSKINNEISINNNLFESIVSNIKLVLENKENFYKKKKEDINILQIEINKLESEKKELEKYLAENFSSDIDKDLELINSSINNIQKDIQLNKSEETNEKNSIISSGNLKESELKNSASEIIRNEDEVKNKKIIDVQKEYSDKLSTMKSELSSLTSELTSLRSLYSTNQKEIEKIKIEEHKILSALNEEKKICPLCNQVVGEENLKYLQNRYEELEKIFSDLKTKSEKITIEGKEKSKYTELLEKQIKEIESELKEKLDKISSDHLLKISEISDKLKSKISLLNSLIKQKIDETIKKYENILKDFNDKLLTYLNVKKDIENKILDRNEILNKKQTIDNKINVSKNLLSQKNKEEFDDSHLNQLYSQRNKIIEKTNELLELKDKLVLEIEAYEFWKSGFSMSGGSIPSMLIDESIPFMNKKVMEYLDQIGGRYIVSFDTLGKTKAGEFRDKISINILDTLTKANSRKQLSGGQTRIVDIAIILTLCDLQSTVQNMKTNIILLDEIFDALDDQNIGYVSNLLRKMIKDKSVNIISHRHIDQIEADEVLRFI